MKEARPHFQGTCKQFTDREREIVLAVARGDAVGGALTSTVESLDERGYLRPDAGRLVVFSECFRTFVVEQQCVAEPVPAAPPPPGAPTAKVFISYAREDQDEVKDLYGRLAGIGVSPWMDQENLVIGDPWARTIDEAILSADFFLCCISTHSVDKTGVLRQELSKGLNQWYARSGPDNYLLPVMLEDCPMPASLAALQRVDLWTEDGWVRLRDGLHTAIERRRTSRRRPPDPPPRRLPRAWPRTSSERSAGSSGARWSSASSASSPACCSSSPDCRGRR